MTEAVVSVAVIAVMWLGAAGVFVMTKVNGSMARHKTQAILVAQRAIEDLHKKAFSAIVNSTATVSIDTRGTPDNYSDDLSGTQVITVTPISSYYKKVVVTVSWNEKLPGKVQVMRERCASFIANDPQVN